MIVYPRRPFHCAATNAADRSLLRWRLSGPVIGQDAHIAFASRARLAITQPGNECRTRHALQFRYCVHWQRPVKLALQA